MANYKSALIESNPAAAWMLDTASSTDTDLALGARDAVVSVADKASVPIASGGQRSLTLALDTDQINYPPLNIWNQGNAGTPFSVEFVVKNIGSPNLVKIFAPVYSAGDVPDNYIGIHNNKLSFVVSDATLAQPYTQRYEAHTWLDYTGGTYHCVAVYQSDAISLYVNNELVSTTGLGANFDWRHDANPTYPLVSRGAAGSFVMLSGLAVHKRALDPKTITSHFRQMSVRPSVERIAKAKRGSAFKINDSDRSKLFYFNSPRMNPWSEAILTNLSIVNNKLTLNRIDPPTLNTGTATYASQRLVLGTNQYLLIDNAGSRLASGVGAVGTFVRYTAARHGAISADEYSIMSIFNSEKTCVIDVVEKDDAKIYLRYTSNGVAFSDQLVASPATGSDSDNYLFLTFSSTEISAYWNDDVTAGTIDLTSEGGTATPQFNEGSKIIIGASANETRFWAESFWWLNIWSTPPPPTDILLFNSTTQDYTLKLSNSLNVSQRGRATWLLDTGYDGFGPEEVNQSRVWWSPQIPTDELFIETGLTGSDSPETVYNDDFEDLYGSSSGNYDVSPNQGSLVAVPAGTAVPETIYLRATFNTDDSVNNLVFLKRIGLDLFETSDVVAEDGLNELRFLGQPQIAFSTENIGLQEINHGAKIVAASNACQIYSSMTTDPLTDVTDVPAGATTFPSSQTNYARTVEFWLSPEAASTGLIFKHKGGENHTLSYNGASRVFSVAGFDLLYIDGQPVTLTAGNSPAQSTAFNGKWHLVHLVMRDVIDQRDNTLFPIISGAPTVYTDEIKSYIGSKSFKLAAGASTGVIGLYNSITNINTGAGAKNSLVFFVYPNFGVTSVNTNFRYNSISDTVTHSGLVPEKWNMVVRTYTNLDIISTMDIRLTTVDPLKTVWLSGAGLVKGSDPFIRFNDVDAGSSWFGYDVDQPGVDQGRFGLQNVVTYRAALTATEILNIYAEHAGNYYAALNSGSTNRMPLVGNSMSDAAPIINRNPESAGEDLFFENPVHLSSAWQILAAN